MDPISIISLVSTCTGIAGQAGKLVKDLTDLVQKMKEAHQAAKQLLDRMVLFKETLHQLKIYIERSGKASRRTKSTLQLFLSACKDVLSHIQVKTTAASKLADTEKFQLLRRIQLLWNEREINDCEQKLSAKLTMLHTYVQLVQLNKESDQEQTIDTALFTQSLRDATEGSVSAQDWDRATTLDDWDDSTSVSDSTISKTKFAAKDAIVPATRQLRSISSNLRSLVMSPRERSKLASSLCAACEYRNYPKVKRLIEQNAPVNKESDGRLPLCTSIRKEQFTITKLLLENGADANKSENQNPLPLNIAISTNQFNTVKLLIQHGADVNKLSGGCSALVEAIQKDNIQIVELLIENEANANRAEPRAGGFRLLTLQLSWKARRS